VFRYSLRTVLSILSALIISFILTPFVIRKFHDWKISSGKREDVPDRHEAKKETPTMGGFVILIATMIPTLLWRPHHYYIWVVSFSFVSFGAIGFMDDVKKLKGEKGKVSRDGRSSPCRYSSASASARSSFQVRVVTQLTVPFFKNLRPDLGVFYIACASSLSPGHQCRET
jgi:phospho-N-acetylmuramoyl-pentapeptide-transferase